jgi:hypothetical protein
MSELSATLKSLQTLIKTILILSKDEIDLALSGVE